MSNIINEADKVTEIIKAKTGHDIAAEDVEKVQKLASTLVIRSARLVTASFVGIIWQQAGSGKAQKQHIAIDGSVYEKMPLAKENIMRALSELLGEEAAVIDTVLENGGSGLGAAIAAAMSQK
jgi:hexokinase